MKRSDQSKHQQDKLHINHLLVVDDDNITDFIVEEVIHYFSEIKHYKFETNGWKALEYLAHCKKNRNFPDLILLDLKMPVMTGVEFLLRYEHLFHQDYPHTKLVVVTNHYSYYKNEMREYSSINLILNKPINTQKLQNIKDTLNN